MLKDIFSHKIAIFIYGFIIAITILVFVIDNTYKERINNLQYELKKKDEKSKSLKNENSVLNQNIKQLTKILNELNVKDLVETNKSQQTTIAELLKEKKMLEEEIQKLRKKLKNHELSQIINKSIALKDNEKFTIDGKDITLLVRRISAILIKLQNSEGLNVKLDEYRSLIKELKKILPDDVMIKNIRLIKSKAPYPIRHDDKIRREEIRANTETQLFLIFDYLKDKYTRDKF